MLDEHLQKIFRSLADAHVRYLVVGGLAVVAHGHARFTADLDLVVALDRQNVLGAMKALEGLGYAPRAPVAAEALADEAMRQDWVQSKGMVVFQMFSEKQPETAIDIFVREPFDFESEYQDAPRFTLVEGPAVPVVSIGTLLRMKTVAGRARDVDDVEKLRIIEQLRSGGAG